MNLDAIAKISASLETVMLNVDKAADLFFGRLFTLDPAICALFPDDLQSHGRLFLQTLAQIVSRLDTPEKIIPIVKNLGRIHTRQGVQPHHYHTFGNAYLWMLAELLGPDFNDDLALAWEEAYHLLAGLMKETGGG